ncbi:histidine kinase [Dactylosporangium sp. NPDC051485]|uniref:sensor histidine kinase n=1 Tax=Dactylosporangium sp. NPDC051485 TaxID=3154846 RepID=UPI00341C3693
MRRRWVLAGRGAAYLLGALCTAVASVVALPLLCHPTLSGSWARWHRRRAARLRGAPVETQPTRLRRLLGWLPVHVAVAVTAGAFALLCLGNLVFAAAVVALWWAFPADDPPSLLLDVPVHGWGTAVALGLAQVTVLAALAWSLFPPLADAHARVTLAMLAPAPADRLAERVVVLTRTRADALEAHGAELRRIERDLHDGTQARLVAIAMRLAVARQELAGRPDPLDRSDAVSELLREAHEGAEEAMTELRAVIRTIYPPILADHGLAGALQMMAVRGGVPVDVDMGELGQVPAAVEAVAYFAVTEALTNVAKHSHAARAAVRVRRTGDRLSIAVRDDGVGGAGEHHGTGLTGIRRRAEALDGTLAVASPAGGPTEITVDLPCGW